MRVGYVHVRRTAASSSLALAAVALLSLAGVHSQTDPSLQPSAAGTAFSLKGSASGLYPGATTPLTVTVVNPHRFRIRVTRLRVRVRADALHPDCAPETYFQVSTLSRPFTVPRRGSGRTQLSMTMLPEAPDACSGVQLPLVLNATAERS